jgi:hypothetical protein
MSSWLVPAARTSCGHLTFQDHELLHHYKTTVWRAFAVRQDSDVHDVLRDVVPQLSISQPHLIYALLSIAATHSNAMNPSKQIESQALFYRQKTFQEYSKALQNITSEKYESIIVTGTFLLNLIPPPSTTSDEEHLDWMTSLLKLSEGLRVLASLRWAQGIEKLSVYPLICRELRTLPPPPLINAGVDAPIGPVGTTPDNPNPAATYRFKQPQSTSLFLPPSLMAILQSILMPSNTGPMDFHGGTLKPVFHALSPIFLSLYYYHLNSDFYVRVFVFTSFLMPDFLQLVKDREPRALVLVAWWFALADLVPKGWWVGTKVGNVVRAIGRVIRGRDSYTVQINAQQNARRLAEEAFEGAERIVDQYDTVGREDAAKVIFECWHGVDWDQGTQRAEEWEFEQLLDLGDIMSGTTLGAA